MGRNLVFDIEANGFTPSEIFALGMFDLSSREYFEFYGDNIADGLVMLEKADIVIGHYVKGYDLPVIKRLTEGLINIPKEKVIDTLEMSRMLFPNNKRHSISVWGEIFGYPKLEWSDFSKFDIGMLEYMRRDIDINVLLYEFFVDHMSLNEPLLEIA